MYIYIKGYESFCNNFDDNGIKVVVYLDFYKGFV